MDAGIASEANLRWLRAQGLHYVVKSRLRERQFDPAPATEVKSAGQAVIKTHRVLDEQGHALLYCHSPAREQKGRAIDTAGELKFIGAILERPVIEKILTHLGLQARAPPREPARRQALQAA